MKSALFLAACLLLTPALIPLGTFAQTAPTMLVMKASVTDGDGRITLGDVFGNAGAASDVLLGYRQGATAVLDAAAVQSIAARSGVYWDNPRGLRRIIVASGPETGSAQRTAITAPQNYSGWNAPAIAPAAATSQIVVKRAETVSVTWTQNGLSLIMSGQAQKDGSIGDVIQIQNPSSKKVIDAVITGPGQAVAGQAATQLRNQTLLSSR